MDLHLHPHLAGPHIPEPHNCCLRATGEVREAGKGFVEQGPISIPLCLLGPLFLLGGKRVGGPLLLVELPPAGLVSGMAGCSFTTQSPYRQSLRMGIVRSQGSHMALEEECKVTCIKSVHRPQGEDRWE